MATLKVEGFEEAEKMLLRKEAAAVEAVPEMLAAGAEILVKAQRESINRMARGQGTLAASIGATPIRSSGAGSYIDVYPQGDQPHGTPRRGKKGSVSNAQVGFLLEYGSRQLPARPWMTAANEESAEAANEAMRKVWEAKISNG
jgi:hypothetical protein